MDFKNLGILLVCITIGLLGIEYIAYAMQTVTEEPNVYSATEEDSILLYLALFTATSSLIFLITAYFKDDPGHS